jgi:solute carrier family 13 (sodium-dependent dicarboxylate transporter), member 2/3/5
MKSIFSNYRKPLALLAGVLVFVLLYFLNPLHLINSAAVTLAIGGLMITWWVLEALPLAVVALVPIVLFPLFKVATLEETTVSFSNPIIFLFMGGFFIGLAIERWNLHKRIALSIVNITGTNGNRIVLGFILATGFLSMWLSNTATTMMMFPIAMSVIHVMKENEQTGANINNFALTIMLSIAYASNIGGIGTIIGTPPNVAFVGFIAKRYEYNIGFLDWMLLCTPLAIALLLALYFTMTHWLFPNRIADNAVTKQFIRSELKALGPLSTAEKRVLAVFIGTAFLWITKDLINKLHWVKLDDTIIAILGSLFLFIIPSGSKEPKNQQLLEWHHTKNMAWGILLLFGGGIALANALEKAGLIGQLGAWIGGFSGNNVLLLILVITAVSIFLSEIMSNVAQVIVLSPVIAGVAEALKMDPMLLGIPMALAASCAAMLPMGTPPNAIVFASGYIRLKDMFKVGLVINLISILLITLFAWLLLPKLMALH